MSSISLSEIHGVLLTYTELPTQRVLVQEEHPLEQLCVSLPSPDTETLTLQIFTAHDLLQPRNLELNQGEVSNILYFFILLPLDVNLPLSNEFYKILSVFNQLLPIGSFEVDEESNLYYRYGLLLDEKWGDALFIAEIVQCMSQIFPRVHAWLDKLNQVAEYSAEGMQELKNHFQELISDFPRPKIIPPLKKVNVSSPPKDYFFPLGVVTGCLVTLYITTFNWSWLGLGALLMCSGLTGCLLYKSRILQARLGHLKKQKNQLDFYWKLLEIERVKVQYQFLTLKKQNTEVDQTLSQFSIENISTPGDLIRGHYYTRYLKDFKETLEKRQHTLIHQKEEIYRSCEQLYEEQKSFFSDLCPSMSKREWGEVKVCLSEYKISPNPEAFLFKNLQQTLDFLGFKTQELTKSSEFVVYTAKESLPIHLSYKTHWHCQTCHSHQSWMIAFYLPFELKIPTHKLKEVSTLITMSNRYLPLGTLILESKEQQLGLKYHFVRGQGDISSFLIIEILELLAFFGTKMESKIKAFLQEEKTILEVLHDTEAEFQSLPKGP